MESTLSQADDCGGLGRAEEWTIGMKCRRNQCKEAEISVGARKPEGDIPKSLARDVAFDYQNEIK